MKSLSSHLQPIEKLESQPLSYIDMALCQVRLSSPSSTYLLVDNI